MINFRMGSYAFFFFSIFVFSCFYLVPSNCLNFDFFVKICEFIPEFLFSFSIDYTFFYFSFMVSTVSYMVLIFSSIYLEFYNNLKYLKLLSFFIASMLFLCSCVSLMPFFTGWDFLGISSILLILFYPNKITSFNTFITFFFNRLSDCMLIFCFCFVLLESSMLFFSENYFFVIFMILCAFLKSAQYPFSSWLPAAMSAPTPISSLVHSSTLVTAGILILFKSGSFMFFFFSNLCFIFLLGALVGGSLACLEWDLKKMVAYSTLSQISVIMLMSSLGFLSLGMVHMIFHAFFKSFLFFSCGMFFMSSFSNQFYGSSTSSFLTHFLIWVSVFSMSGILFSSSFLTKDLFLEFQLENSLDFMFYFFLLISLLTLIYCNFLLVGVSSSFSNYTSKGNFFMYKSLCGFSLLLLVSPFYLFFLNLKESSFFLSWSELFILCSIFLSTLFMSISRSFKLSYLSFDTFHLKSSLSLGFSRPLLYDMKDIFSGDYFMFKSNLLWIFSVNKYWVSFLFFVVFLLTL